MANLSDLFPSASASPIKSVQSGYVDTSTLSTGSGEDDRYLDVAISAVDTTKLLAITFVGGVGSSGRNGMSKSGPSQDAFDVIPKLTSSTNLRLSIPTKGGFTAPSVVGRWRIVEAV